MRRKLMMQGFFYWRHISAPKFYLLRMWRFPEMGAPPNHPFWQDFPWNQPSSYLGYPHGYGKPQINWTSKNSTDMFTVHHLELGILLLSARAGSDGCYNPMVQFFFSPTFQPQHPPGANPGYGCNVLELKKRNHGWYTARNWTNHVT